MDYPLSGYARNAFVVRCVVGRSGSEDTPVSARGEIQREESKVWCLPCFCNWSKVWFLRPSQRPVLHALAPPHGSGTAGSESLVPKLSCASAIQIRTRFASDWICGRKSHETICSSQGKPSSPGPETTSFRARLSHTLSILAGIPTRASEYPRQVLLGLGCTSWELGGARPAIRRRSFLGNSRGHILHRHRTVTFGCAAGFGWMMCLARGCLRDWV
jgi:hypothetical protein